MKERVCNIVKAQPAGVELTGLLFAHGTTVPTDGTEGYEAGCLFQKTDGGIATSLYVNEGSVTSSDFNSAANETSVLLGATAGVVTASVAVVVDANKDAGDFRNLDCVNLDAGASGTAGSVDIFPTTAARGKLIIDCQAQDANTNVTLRAAGMAQASVVSIPDPGAATANFMLTDQANDQALITATAAELNVLDAVTAGTVAVSKAVVVDANKDIGDFRNLDCTNLDAGASGTAGSVDIFPTTAAKGKLIIDCADQDGNTNVTLRAAGMGQAAVVSIPDPGAATANFMLTSAANDGARVAATSTEIDVLAAVTGGTVAVSKAVVVDANKDVGDFRNLDCVNLDCGASGTAGTVDIFPTTGSKGKFILDCADQDGNTNITLRAAGAAQATVVSIPDAGAATANVVLTSAANDGVVVAATATEIDVVAGVTGGTAAASKAVVLDGSLDIATLNNVTLTNLDAGASGTAGTVDIFPTTAAKGKLIIDCADQDGNTNVTLRAAGMAQASVISIPDPGAATANVVLTDAANDGTVVTATAAELSYLAGNILSDMSAGSGITSATGEIVEHYVTKVGGVYKTEIVIDMTGLNDGGTAGDIIGDDGGAANCHIGQITAALNGTIIAGRITCHETPAGGNADIDIWSATESTGAQDTAITGLTETGPFLDHGVWAAGEVDYFDTWPAADQYLYLVNGTATDADYTAGRFIIELWGV